MTKFLKQIPRPALAGLLLYFAFRHNFWVLSIFGMGLFYRTLTDQTWRPRLISTLSFASAFFFPLLRWIGILGNDAWILLATLCIALFTVVAIVPVQSGKLDSKIEFAIFWCLMELIRSHFPWGGFSWGLVSYAQTSGPLVQYSRIGSSILVAFVTVLVATVVGELRFFRNFWQNWLALGLIIIGLLFPTSSAIGSVQVGVVQGGVVSSQVPEFARASQVLVHHLEQTRLHTDQLREADFVVWPENSVNLQSSSDATSKQIQQVVDEVGKPFLIGAVRENKKGIPQNVVILWLPKVGQSTSYVKNHLVPFGEYLPLRKLLAAQIGRFNQIPADFEPGQGGGVINVAGTKVGVAICFEVADQSHLSNLVNAGATVLVAASNNATYLGSEQPAQQFEMSRFSAITHQRTMVVATTSGTSGVISADGVVSNRVTDSEGHVFVAKVNLSNNVTFGDRYPKWPFFFVVVATTFFVLHRLRETRRNREAVGSAERS